jgi:protoporphyrinogen oxidase
MTTAILGGGITGVTLARLLHEQGEEVVVLEACGEIGGLCRSRTEEGFTFDTGGSHIIFSRDAEVLGFMQEVLGQNKDLRNRKTKIFYKHRYVKYPFENGLAELPKEDLFFCINEFISTLIAREKQEIPPPETFRDWIYYTFGKGIAELYMIPYNEKIWNFPTAEMSKHWVEGRVPIPPVEDVIRSAIGIETEGYTHQAVFTYPVHGGIEALVNAIAAPVQDTIITGFTVTSVGRSGEQWVVGDGIREIVADECICTIPLQELFPCLTGVPGRVQAAVDALRYNAVCCVCIGVKGNVSGISWLYIPDPADGLENRISFPSNYSVAVAPGKHGAILAEITYNEGDPVSCMSDRELVDHICTSLERMDIISREDVVFTHVARNRFAYVVYDLHYPENIRTIRDYCASIGLPLVGRFAQFEYLNMDGCIRSVIDFVRSRA